MSVLNGMPMNLHERNVRPDSKQQAMTISPKQILSPTDFSQRSLKAAAYACTFRDALGANYMIFTCVSVRGQSQHSHPNAVHCC